jgi:hypothetical protein
VIRSDEVTALAAILRVGSASSQLYFIDLPSGNAVDRSILSSLLVLSPACSIVGPTARRTPRTLRRIDPPPRRRRSVAELSVAATPLSGVFTELPSPISHSAFACNETERFDAGVRPGTVAARCRADRRDTDDPASAGCGTGGARSSSLHCNQARPLARRRFDRPGRSRRRSTLHIALNSGDA